MTTPAPVPAGDARRQTAHETAPLSGEGHALARGTATLCGEFATWDRATDEDFARMELRALEGIPYAELCGLVASSAWAAYRVAPAGDETDCPRVRLQAIALWAEKEAERHAP